MEHQPSPEPQPSLLQRIRQLGGNIIEFASKLDLNPHEGRLRGSVMPVEYMAIPEDPSALFISKE